MPNRVEVVSETVPFDVDSDAASPEFDRVQNDGEFEHA